MHFWLIIPYNCRNQFLEINQISTYIYIYMYISTYIYDWPFKTMKNAYYGKSYAEVSKKYGIKANLCFHLFFLNFLKHSHMHVYGKAELKRNFVFDAQAFESHTVCFIICVSMSFLKSLSYMYIWCTFISAILENTNWYKCNCRLIHLSFSFVGNS